MYDAGKIIVGLIIFLVLITSPVWYNMASGKSEVVPQPKIITAEKECVMGTEYMREKHMDLLNEWRDKAVREGERIHAAPNGRKFNMSLTGTCLNCHSNKTEFCDACHNYSAVGQPYCWDCHNIPEEIK
nr:sulfate reduction electron transfer complex DsrMKJOP subunit DsrJ [candidate division Zixibacteria bacterium]